MLHALLVSVFSANMLVATPAPAHGMALLASASVAMPPLGLVDSIVVEKRAHTLTLFRDGKPSRTYLVALGGRPKGCSTSTRGSPTASIIWPSTSPIRMWHIAHGPRRPECNLAATS